MTESAHGREHSRRAYTSRPWYNKGMNQNALDPPTGHPHPARWLLLWTAVVFCWSILAATLLLLAVMLILGVREVGVYGAIMLVGAAAIALGRCARLAIPHIRAAVSHVKPRFSLQALMVATALCAIAFAWIGNWLRQVQKERQIVDKIIARGGSISWENPTQRWAYPRLGISGVLALGRLDYVILNNHGPGNRRPVTKAELKMISGLRFSRLSLTFTDVTDADLEELRQFPHLKSFDAQMTPIGDQGMRHLACLDELEEIDLWGTQITDEGIAVLSRLPNLHTLSVNRTPVTDRAIDDLKRMKCLKNVGLYKTKVTPEKVEELRRVLPNCMVHYK